MEMNFDMTIHLLERKYDVAIIAMVVIVVIMFIIGAIGYFDDSRTMIHQNEAAQKLGIEDRKSLYEQLNALTKRVELLESKSSDNNFKVQ